MFKVYGYMWPIKYGIGYSLYKSILKCIVVPLFIYLYNEVCEIFLAIKALIW